MSDLLCKKAPYILRSLTIDHFKDEKNRSLSFNSTIYNNNAAYDNHQLINEYTNVSFNNTSINNQSYNSKPF